MVLHNAFHYISCLQLFLYLAVLRAKHPSEITLECRLQLISELCMAMLFRVSLKYSRGAVCFCGFIIYLVVVKLIIFCPELVSLLQFVAVSFYYCSFGSLIDYFSTFSPYWSCYVDCSLVHLYFNCLPTFRKWETQPALDA